MKKLDYDGLLNIKTSDEQKGFHKSLHYHRYEATPYEALDTLFSHYNIFKGDHIVDVGCGKGRLSFFTHYFYNNPVTGIEMDEKFYKIAQSNLSTYAKNKSSSNIKFQCVLAEEYEITRLENIFYFFNPFSVQIFRKVVHNIIRSVEEDPRSVDIILYYPSADYIYFLNNETIFVLEKEIALPEAIHNPNERFLVYRLHFD